MCLLPDVVKSSPACGQAVGFLSLFILAVSAARVADPAPAARDYPKLVDGRIRQAIGVFI